ncbi:hypothetical protein JR316_0009117 [Psilocybe cubensis]|uniref:Uncharacterized protein n=2 Tax=Psilocybe cubensis TaxID=181762 RepID=A0ACB8GSF5_PSICU|nr:hypothetical protein JR316_0009117 [Psilocybe cubensis]KAH9478660.1 hypothetical protein JR316_0009117 [Psilocybe cubensis]
MFKHRPLNLDLTNSRAEKPAALRETGRDAFLPCKTPTSAGFLNRLKFLPNSMTKEEFMQTLDPSHDEETRRSIAFLYSGSFYDDTPYGDHSHLAPPPLPYFSISTSLPIIDDSNVAAEATLDEPEIVVADKKPKLVYDYARQYAIEHGVWPKVSVFNDSYIPEEMYESDTTEGSGDSGADADGEADDEEDMDEDISSYFTPVIFPAQVSQDPPATFSPSPPPELPPAPFIPSITIPSVTIPSSSYDETMDPSSEEDNDNSDDPDFQDPSYERQQQQLHHQFSSAISNTNNVPELSSPSSSSSGPDSPFPITPKTSPKRKTTIKRARAKPYSTDKSARRKSSSGSDDAYDPTSPSPSGGIGEDVHDRSPDKPYITFRCKKTGKMMFQCRACPDIQSKALGDMKRHLEGLRHQKPSYKCDPETFEFGCGREFTRTDALKRHIKSKHPMGWAVYEWEMEEQERAMGGRGLKKARKQAV